MDYPYVNGDRGHNPYPEGNGPPYPRHYPQYPVADQVYTDAIPRTYQESQQQYGFPTQSFAPGQPPYPSTSVSYPGGYRSPPVDGRIRGNLDFSRSAAPALHTPRDYPYREESEVPRQDRTRRDSHPGGGYRVESAPQPRRHTGRDLARRRGNRPHEIEEEAHGVDPLLPGLASLHLNREPAASGPTQIITASASTTLDPRYQVRTDPRRFFRQGRVFSILWHENAGANAKGTNATFVAGQFGEPVYSHIRRMVVIKEYDNCAWCFAIYTYKNRGVSKKNADASKHAIVYMEGSQPAASPSEPPTLSQALEVRPISDEHKLSPMSRMNFGKLFTVEHNVKVAPVGKITDHSMPDFLAYARREIWV